jgi:hypothetical protein
MCSGMSFKNKVVSNGEFILFYLVDVLQTSEACVIYCTGAIYF